ncbi:MAG TPA: DUF202 domain-containing protein [Gemmatimonadaceae bacterium]
MNARVPDPDIGGRPEQSSSERMALDLTLLANERTLLTYVRTALAFFAAGVALIRFFGNPILIATGWLFIPAGVALGIFGAVRHRRVRRELLARWGPSSIHRTGKRGGRTGDS